MNVIGEEPRPCVFTWGLDPESGFADEIRAAFPTARCLKGLNEIRQSDYDAAIICRDIPDGTRFDSHLQLLWFSDTGKAPVTPAVTAGSSDLRPRWLSGHRAARFVVPKEAEDEGMGTLAPSLAPKPHSDYPVLWSLGHLPGAALPLLCEAGGDESVLALILDRTKKAGSEVWCLPERALADPAAWMRAALKRWQTRYPASFPRLMWKDDLEWMAAEERAAVGRVVQHDAASASTQRRLEAERAALTGVLDSARTAADAGRRRLLTTKSDALVDEVTATLNQLGFTVTNSDEQRAGSEKYEDLQVTDQDWVGVVEVKGYEKRNARANDLLELNKAVEAYIKRTRDYASARWYIINQSYATPPPLRTRPLQGSDMVEGFAGRNGLIIDTRDLFRLVVAVESGDITCEHARTLLRDATGVFEYPGAEGAPTIKPC